MPPKVRDLIKKLKKAGFIERSGKGSHRRFQHPSGARLSVSGNPGDDAKPYQEKEVEDVLKEAEK